VEGPHNETPTIFQKILQCTTMLISEVKKKKTNRQNINYVVKTSYRHTMFVRVCLYSQMYCLFVRYVTVTATTYVVRSYFYFPNTPHNRPGKCFHLARCPHLRLSFFLAKPCYVD
jgi:hypothetical protein